LEQCPPTDNVRDGEFEIRKGEVHEVVYGRFGRPTAACRLDARECPIEHRQCPRSHAQDQLIEVLEDVVDRSNGTPLITLVRGRTVTIAEEIADQNPLGILDQQIRAASGGVERAKKGAGSRYCPQSGAPPARASRTSRRGPWLPSRPDVTIPQPKPRRRSRPSRPNAMLQRPLARSSPPRSPS